MPLVLASICTYTTPVETRAIVITVAHGVAGVASIIGSNVVEIFSQRL
jgi:hypothetical protein